VAGTYSILQKAERIERLSADLYRAAADAFPDAPEAPLLRRIAGEEDQHAARVRLLAGRYRADSSLFQGKALEVQGLDALVTEAEELQREIAAGRFRGGLPALLERLAALEEKGEMSHGDALARVSDPRVASFFRQMAGQDRAHRELLKK